MKGAQRLVHLVSAADHGDRDCGQGDEGDHVGPGRGDLHRRHPRQAAQAVTVSEEEHHGLYLGMAAMAARQARGLAYRPAARGALDRLGLSPGIGFVVPVDGARPSPAPVRPMAYGPRPVKRAPAASQNILRAAGRQSHRRAAGLAHPGPTDLIARAWRTRSCHPSLPPVAPGSSLAKWRSTAL